MKKEAVVRSYNTSLDNLSTHYKIHGTGKKNILFLHGWPGLSDSFSAIASHLREQLIDSKIIVPDLPGFGKSEYPAGETWSSSQYTEWLQRLMDDCDIENTDIYAHSFGGRICLRATEKCPDRIGEMILASAAGSGLLPTKKQIIGMKINDIRCQASRIANLGKISPQLKTSISTFSKEDPVKLENIKNKTLILWGEKDNVIPLESAHTLNNAISNSQLLIYPKAGHNLHLTHTNEVAEDVINFCNKESLVST